MNWYCKTIIAAAPKVPYVYHGTTAANGKIIKSQGYLKPLCHVEGYTPQSGGNWSKGLFGGCPSNPTNVYCTRQKREAIQYAKDICGLAKVQQASVVTAIANMNAYVPDEDTLAEWMAQLKPGMNPMADKMWQAYAKVHHFNTIQQAFKYYNDEPDPEADRLAMMNEGYNENQLPDFEPPEGDEQEYSRNNYATNDAALADDMKAAAEILAKTLTPEEKMVWFKKHTTAAFASPLKVVKVEFFNVGQQ